MRRLSRAAMPRPSPPRRPSISPSAYFASRFRPHAKRERAWRGIATYLSGWWDPLESTIIDVGAGYCSFINAARAKTRIAVDIHDGLDQYADADVTCMQASATDLGQIESTTCDVVFASNLLEHLTRDEIGLALAEFLRVLRPGGRLILVQPNYRLCCAQYYDDYTHVTPLSDRSLGNLLEVHGFELRKVEPRFLPLTLNSAGSRLTFLLPVYLRSPFRPLARQMLLIAESPKA